MERIAEAQRLPMMDAIHGHWGEAETEAGVAIEIVPGFGRPQFFNLRGEYHTLADDVTLMEETTLPNLIAARDAIFGTSGTDPGGVWIRLLLYKDKVRKRLGARHPLSKTVPNLGKVTVETYLKIIHRFANHWALVNAALPSPLVIGTFTVAMLLAAHDAIDAKMTAIETMDEVTLPLARSEKEKFFGDVPDDERDDESVVARMLLYDSEIRSRFLTGPLVVSLPEIFPPEAPATVPTFEMNWVMQPGSVLKLWFVRPNVTGGALVGVDEGSVEQTQPLPAGTPGEIEETTWSGIVIVNEIDRVTIRNGDGVTIARGVRNTALPEPVGV
jgi:hypothetical protein